MDDFKVEIDVQSYLTVLDGKRRYTRGRTWDFIAGRGLSVAQIKAVVEEKFRWSTDQRMTIWYGYDGETLPLICETEIAELFDRCSSTKVVRFIFSKQAKLEEYVDESFSVERFKAAYKGVLMPIRGKSQWPKVNPGFDMVPPKLIRSAGRPRTRRILNHTEGGGRRHKCKRCGKIGHLKKTCKEPETDSDVDRDATPPPRKKSKVEASIATPSSPKTPTKQGTPLGTPLGTLTSPMTRKRAAAIAIASSPPSASTRSKTVTPSPLRRV